MNNNAILYQQPSGPSGTASFTTGNSNSPASSGVQYFNQNGTPISNAEFSRITGQDASAIEAAQKQSYDSSQSIKTAQQELGENLSNIPDTYAGAAQAAAQAKATADEQAAYNDQISQLDQLLGYTETQKTKGLGELQGSFEASKTRLNAGLDAQGVQNQQAKEKGVGQVDQYGNDSYKSLQRLLQGANAGNSSVGRDLIPYLLSKGMGQRRSGVMDTFGQNEQSLNTNRTDENQNLENQRKKQESSFLEGILGKQNELSNQKYQAQIARDMAGGQGYAQAQAGAQGIRSGMNDRQAQLAGLFDTYKQDFTYNAPKPLSEFTVDKGLIGQGGQQQTGQSFYLQQLKKKQQEGIA